MSFDIFSNDRAFVGTQTLSVKALISSGELIQDHSFDILFYDSCNSTTLVQNQLPETIEIDALSSESKNLTLKAFTDSVSVSYGLRQTCGSLAYKAITPDKSLSVTVQHKAGEATYSVIVDTKSFSKVGKQIVTIEVALVDYPLVAKAQTLITVDVKSTQKAWVPPLPEDEKEKENEDANVSP